MGPYIIGKHDAFRDHVLVRINDDDLAFVRGLMDEGILAVPGAGFGRSGYFRLSLTAPRSSIERALPGFGRALQKRR